MAARIGARLPARLRGSTPPDRAGRKALLALVGLVAGAVTAPLPAAFAAAPLLSGCGWRLPDLAAGRRLQMRRAATVAALPDALDLLAVCALGGMGIDPALRLVAPQTPGPLGEALRAATTALDVGMPRGGAYAELVRVTGADEVRRVVAALERAERYGASIADALAAQAREIRDRRRTSAEERALGAPVRMLFPLALCFLPAFVLLTIAPALLVALRSFQGL
jgi:tight adherence protein C